MARAYIKIVHKGVPIPGDSPALGWINWIEVAQFSVRPAPGPGGGTPPGGGQLQLVEVGKRLDVSSPALAQALAKKTVLDSMTIDVMRMDHTQKVERQTRLEFSDVTVVSRSSVANAPGSPAPKGASVEEPFTERVTFRCASMKINFGPGEVSRDQWQ